MARREHLLRDAEGPMIGHQTQKQEAFPMSKGRIEALEEAVEGFKSASRADMTYDGFAQAQQRQRNEIKKQTRSNGTGRVPALRRKEEQNASNHRDEMMIVEESIFCNILP